MYKKVLSKSGIFLLHDIAIVALSILIAVVLVRTNIISDLILSTEKLKIFGSFFAGMFFTSIFTTAPAIATLGSIAQNNSIVLTAFFGALGAVLGDLVIFSFIKDRLTDHFYELIGHNNVIKRTRALFKLKYFRWVTFFFGGLLIASPLPDELGIGLLGFSKMKTSYFIPLTFFFNFIGILIIGIIANTL